MPVVRLAAPPVDQPPGPDTLRPEPRRLVLTLAELRALHDRLGQPPLPVRLSADGAEPRLVARLGTPPRRVDDPTGDDAHRTGGAGVADATQDVPAALAATMTVLAYPEVRVSVQWTVGAAAGCRRELHAWIGLLGPLGAALTTADGTTFELSAFPSGALANELARMVAPTGLRAPGGYRTLPAKLLPPAPSVPYELFLAGLRACREGRGAILDQLVLQAQREQPEAVPNASEVTGLLRFLHREERGRLRLTVSRLVTELANPTVGVVSWVLLAGGWVAVETVTDEGAQCVVVRPVEPADLGRAVGAMLVSVPG